VQILRQHTFWHAQWDTTGDIKMPEIGDILDVTIEDLSPEQLQQLKDATDQFQLKCLMSFKKNRSGVPYLKNEMPRVLLSGETDATTLQEKEECIQAFRDSAEAVLGRHHKAFLSMFKQMMVGVFGPGMEQVFNEYPLRGIMRRLGSPAPLSRQELNHHCRVSQSSLLHKALGDSQFSRLHTALEVSQCNLLCELQGDSQSSHPYKAVQVNPFNSQIHISLRMGRWRSAQLEYCPIPLTR
jgi:hypothetical protein